MIREGRVFGFGFCVLAVASLARAGDGARERASAARAPLDIPHVVALADKSKRKRTHALLERPEFLDPRPGLAPFKFPKNSDMRARIVTPELRRTPLVGWVAANLYRDKKDKGWCVELDPGQGEYVVFYRAHLK